MTPPSDSIEARIAAFHQFVSVPHDEWSSSFWHSQLDDALEVIDALADRAREAEEGLEQAVQSMNELGGGLLEEADRAEAAEAEAKTLREALRQIEVLLDSPRAAEPFVRGQALGETQRALRVT